MLRILIFDSGVGGLSISQCLLDYLPTAEQILLSDNAYFPYGEMEQESLINRVTELLVKATEQLQPDCIVVACNTVSTVALEKIRHAVSIPIIGVVPAIKPAATLSHSKVIGLLATPATVERSYTAGLVNDYASDCKIIQVGNTRLVELSEMHLRGTELDLSEIKLIIKPFIDAEQKFNLDTLILGCTHFPLLSDLLKKLLPQSIRLIDSSDAIARQVKNILTDEDDMVASNIINNRCYMTKLEQDNKLEYGLRRFGFEAPMLFNY